MRSRKVAVVVEPERGPILSISNGGGENYDLDMTIDVGRKKTGVTKGKGGEIGLDFQ